MDLFVTSYTFDTVSRISLDTVSILATLALTPAGGPGIEDCILYGDYLIIARNGAANGELVRVDINTFAEVDILALPELQIGNGSPHCCLAIVGTTLYIAANNPAGGVLGGIVRVDLNTFTRIDRLDLPDNRPHITTDGTYLYVGYYIIAGIDRIDRINLGTFAIDATVNLTNPETMAMYIYGGNLYITHGTGPAPDIVTRISLAPFAETGNLVLGAGEAWGYGLVSDGTYLYCGCASGVGLDGYVVRIDLATFTRVDSIIMQLLLGEDDAWTVYVYNNFLWVLCENVPGVLVQIDIPTFTRVGSLPFGFGDSWAGALWAAPVVPPPTDTAPLVTTLPATGVT